MNKLFILILFVCISCSSSQKNVMQQFEDKGYKQFQSDTLHLRFQIVSSGAFEAELNGALKLFGKRFSKLTVGGHFGYVPVDMQWIST